MSEYMTSNSVHFYTIFTDMNDIYPTKYDTKMPEFLLVTTKHTIASFYGVVTTCHDVTTLDVNR